MKRSNRDKSFKNKKLFKECRVEVTNCLKAYKDFLKIKSRILIMINLGDTDHRLIVKR